ncbi:MAG: CPBP family intramembrane metalloprotease [Hyphomicrobiaceae bacterium]|nr:CPBP family intramembrane metalloprotease [Hyphomicrobiaceae bacterium]
MTGTGEGKRSGRAMHDAGQRVQSLALHDVMSGPPRHRAVTAWGPASALLALVAMALVIIALQVLVFWLATKLLGVEEFNAQIVGTGLEAPLMLISTMLTQVPLIAMVWLAANRGGLRAETLQFAQPPLGWGASILAGLGLAAVLAGLLAVMHLLVPGYSVLQDTRSFVSGLQSPLWWGTVLAIGVLAPISEELAFRGYLLTALAKSRLGIIGAGLVANVLWAAPHFQYSAAGLVTVFSGGLLLTWLVWRTGSIRAAIVAHMVANCVLLAYLASVAPA